jgi:hypothetical protein
MSNRNAARALAIYRETRKPHHYGNGSYQTRAGDALTGAKYCADILTRFEHAERAGLVRIESEPDADPWAWDNYFDGDTFDPEKHPGHPGGARAILAEKKRAESLLESWGLMTVTTSYRTHPDGPWEHADSISGIEGNADERDAHGYGPDLMGTALDSLVDALRDAQRERADLRANRCPRCHQFDPINNRPPIGPPLD